MARFLFVVPPLTGHVNPTLSVARELEDRGHACAFVAHAHTVGPLLPPGTTLFGLDEDQAARDALAARARQLRGAAALKFLYEDFFIPLAHHMLPGIDDALECFGPDVVVSDQHALAGGLAARRRGLPWASLATTSAGVVDPVAGLPRVRAWHRELLAALEVEVGLAPAPRPETSNPELSPHLVIAFTTEALVGAAESFPPHFHFVGPSLRHRREAVPFPWDALAPGRKVLVSLGTVNMEAGARFFGEVMAAVEGLDVQVVLVAPEALAPNAPPNVLVRDYVPQLALLEHLDAVVCHGGHNTVAESLAHGLPLVLAPIKDDQPLVAEQVVAAGAGLRVKFGRVRAPRLRETLLRVLDEPAFRAAARRIQASFAQAGGARRAADHLEALL